jgi:DNA-directed RNA polymerase specialized sigma24 family protein
VSTGEFSVVSADLKVNSAFAVSFDAHAPYLYDYCLSLIGDEGEAAGATRVTFVAAFMVGGRRRDPDQQRAWLFALARRECLSDSPTRRQPWIAPTGPAWPTPGTDATSVAFAEAETSEIPRQGFDAEIRRAVRTVAPEAAPRPDLKHEVLSLVHRYGISPLDLPAILDISRGGAQDLLSAARDSPDESSEAPLATLPGSLRRETTDAIFGAGQREYREAVAADAGRLWARSLAEEAAATPPSTGRLAITSAGLAAALLAPAAVGAVAYVLVAASPAAATRVHGIVATPIATPAPSTSVPDRTVAHSTKAKVHHKTTHHSRVSVHSLPTTTGTTTSARPSHSSTPKPKPSSSTPVIGPDPTPTPTSTSPTSPSPSDHSTSPSPPPSSSSSSQSPSGQSPSSSEWIL